MEIDFSILVNNAEYVLIIGGIIAIAWFLEKLLKPVPVVGTTASILAKIVSFFGFFAGIILIITGAAAWQTQAPHVDTYTIYLLIIAGLVLMLKPIKDFPWAALLGLIAGGLSAGAIYFFFPLPETVLGIASIWVYIIIFLIPAVIVYMVFKFIEDVFKLIGTLLASKPVTLIVGFVCIAQGILLLLDKNLFTILLA
ncbi:MAG TPA: hypothetical protein ENN36_09165 [Candidatus Bathyarchaeota archaeon]|nr:hypothetical protein [Candidatus Bathyarchaeota archaeon]